MSEAVGPGSTQTADAPPALPRLPVERIVRRHEGAPVEVGGRTVAPVVEVSGWIAGDEGAAGGGAGGWLSVRPVEVVVREPDGSERRQPLVDPTREALRGMALGAVVVALLGLLIGRLVRD